MDEAKVGLVPVTNGPLASSRFSKVSNHFISQRSTYTCILHVQSHHIIARAIHGLRKTLKFCVGVKWRNAITAKTCQQVYAKQSSEYQDRIPYLPSGY